MYFTLNITIEIQGKWFLRYEQFEIKREELIELVDHKTHYGKLSKAMSREKHYVIEKDGAEYTFPAKAGSILNFLIPEKFKNTYKYEERKYSDNIRDYVKAAAKYLNIEIRYRPETAAWYRGIDKPTEKENPGKELKDDQVN